MIIFFFSWFFFFLIFFLKDFFFFSKFFFMDLSTLFMICIFPLVGHLILGGSMVASSQQEWSMYKFLFKWVFFFLFFCFCSYNSFFFLLFLENCVILMILLIFLYSKDEDKISSTLFMFLINIFPSILFMYFCSFWDISDILSIFTLSEVKSILLFWCFLGLLLSKLPLFLMHFWLTKAHVSASGSGSMILASLMLKIGSMGLFKFSIAFCGVFKLLSGVFFFFVSWGMIILLSIMIRFFDLKYLVACSSIVHMSPIFCVSLFCSSESIFSIMLMMVGHGLISYLIFFLVTVLYELSYNRSMDFNKSSSSFSNLIHLFFFFFFLMNMGFPPFCSFLSELLFLHTFFIFDNFVFILFCFSLLMSGLMFFFSISKSFFGKKIIMSAFYITMSNFFCSYFYLICFMMIPFFFF